MGKFIVTGNYFLYKNGESSFETDNVGLLTLRFRGEFIYEPQKQISKSKKKNAFACKLLA